MVPLTVLFEYLQDVTRATLNRDDVHFCIWRNTFWIAQELVENRLGVFGRVAVAFHVIFPVMDSNMIMCDRFPW